MGWGQRRFRLGHAVLPGPRAMGLDVKSGGDGAEAIIMGTSRTAVVMGWGERIGRGAHGLGG